MKQGGYDSNDKMGISSSAKRGTDDNHMKDRITPVLIVWLKSLEIEGGNKTSLHGVEVDRVKTVARLFNIHKDPSKISFTMSDGTENYDFTIHNKKTESYPKALENLNLEFGN